MLTITASRSNQVLAWCRDATVLAFDFGRENTLGELAGRLADLAIPHGGLSQAVRVRLDPTTPYAGRSRPAVARRKSRSAFDRARCNGRASGRPTWVAKSN